MKQLEGQLDNLEFILKNRETSCQSSYNVAVDSNLSRIQLRQTQHLYRQVNH